METLLTFDNILSLIRVVSDSSLTSFSLTEGTNTLSMTAGVWNEVRKCRTEQENPVSVQTAAVPEVPPESHTSCPSCESEPSAETINSNMVGTFYASGTENGDPFVHEGDAVKAGQTVGIVEAMKLMNEIKATKDGVIEKILVENGDLVEYGQPLFQMR